jgi:NADH/NAD ratio-sensing transcriptional regulator Rex
MGTITVEKMEMYYAFFENILNRKHMEIISDKQIAKGLKIPELDVKNDLCCICDTDRLPEKHSVYFLLKKLQNILCSFRYTNNCLRYFLPEDSRFVYA